MITRTRTTPALGAVIVLALFIPTGAETAQRPTPTGAGSNQGLTVVAPGLADPHGPAFAPDGSPYVTESDAGGAGH